MATGMVSASIEETGNEIRDLRRTKEMLAPIITQRGDKYFGKITSSSKSPNIFVESDNIIQNSSPTNTRANTNTDAS